MLMIDDFCYSRRGTITSALFQHHIDVLQPLDIKNTKKGNALLLLHGFSSSPAVFREIVPALRQQYDAIVCPILPGHAENIAAFSMAKASEWITTAELTCKNLLDNFTSVDVMGLSLGGLLACHLSQYLPIHHAYLLAPALKLKRNQTFALYLARILQCLKFKSIRNAAGDIYIDTHSELTYRRLPISAIIEIFTLIRQFKLTSPRCPTDVFLGYFDSVVDSNAVANDFEGIPNSHIHWLKKSAHILPLDGDMDTIVTCIKSNLKKAEKS